MNKFLNFSTLKGKAIETLKRFDLCVLFIVALTIALCTMIIVEDMNAALIFYLSAGVLMSLMFKLWEEERGANKNFRIIEIVCHVALIADAVVLYNINEKDMTQSIAMAQGAIIVAMVLGICFLPFIKQTTDVHSWNFVRRMFFAAIISFIVADVMSIGMSILILLINTLFSLNITYKIYGCLWIIFSLALPLLLILGQTPAGNDKHDNSTQVKPFLLGVTRYLFIPLLIAYIAVSLFYVLKTVVQWELPNGQVSWLVTAMTAWLIFVEFLLYPVLRSEAKPFEKFIARYAPLLVLPAVILMTVGLVRRFCDYGISINRLYMIMLNVWFYIVAIGLFLTKARRIHWVSLSFGTLLLLSSTHPWNFSFITKKVLMSDINKALDSNPPKQMPMTAKEVYQWLQSFDNKKEADKLFEKLSYIENNYNSSSLQTLLKTDEYIYKIRWDDSMGVNNDINIDYTYERSIEIPTDAKSVFACQPYNSQLNATFTNEQKDDIRLSMNKIGNQQNESIVIECKLAQIRKAAKDSSMIVWHSTNGKYTVIPTSLHISYFTGGNQIIANMDVMVFKK